MVLKGLAIGLAALLLSACGPASPYVIDQPQPDEIPPGRGLFTGKAGEYVLWGSPSDAEEPTSPRPTDSPGKPVSSATTPYKQMPVAAPTIERGAQTTYGVHFASYGNVELAQQGWSRIWSKHWQMLSGVQPYIDYGSLRGGQPRHHLFGRGLAREQAEGLCRSLRQRNEYCAVVNF